LAGDLITRRGRRDPSRGAEHALLGGAIANLKRRTMRARVATVHKVAIARCLIAVGSRLLSIGRGLVAVRPGLVGIRKCLVPITQRLPIFERPRSRVDAIYRIAGHSSIPRVRVTVSPLYRHTHSWTRGIRIESNGLAA
jgi:hypothetical protein